MIAPTNPPGGRLYLFSSELERSAAFPDGVPDGITTDTTGIGLVDAGIGTARSVDEILPSEIVFIGTCGAYRGSGLKIGDVVLPHEVSLVSGDTASGAMRVPSLMESSIFTDFDLMGRVRSELAALADRVSVGWAACTLGITETDALADALCADASYDVENLEAFPVLRAAGEIPTAVVLGVTNMVGAGGGEDWRRNFRAMMREIAATIIGGG